MKVIQVLNHFLPYQAAGTEMYVWSLSKQLQQLKYEVTVLIPNYGAQRNAEYNYDGLTVVKYAEPSLPDRALITGQKLPEGLNNFIQYLKKQKPDIVHFHEVAGSNGIGVAHFEAAKATGAKVVFTLHLAGNTCNTGSLMYKGTTLCDGVIREIRCARCTLVKKTGSNIKAESLLMPARILFAVGIDSLAWQNSLGTALSTPFRIQQLKSKLERIALVCDKLVPITEWYYKILLRNNVDPDKMKIILQGLPTAVDNQLSVRAETKLPLKIIFIGRIDKLKGIHLLIDAIKHFTAEQIEVDIYGTPTYEEFFNECKAATASLPFVRWMGKIDQNIVVPTISNYDALILPSTFSEMSPLVIQEAFVAGVPVIGSNVYGIAEQVQHGVNGWLFQFENKDALQNLLKSLIDDPSLINKAKQQLPQVKSFKEVAIKYNQLYKEIIS